MGRVHGPRDDWDDNAYETEIWLVDARGSNSAPRQLTNAKKSSLAPSWSPDSSKLAFISDRTDKRQVYIINPQAGEAEAVTTLEDGVDNFAWSPDGKSLAYTATEPKSTLVKDREKKYGELQIVEQDYRMVHLSILDVATKTTRSLTSGSFTVGSFVVARRQKHRVRSPREPGDGEFRLGGRLDRPVADGSVRALVAQAGPDTNPVWSPDGSRIAFTTAMANPNFFYTNRMIATVPAAAARRPSSVKRSTRIRRSSGGHPTACSSPHRIGHGRPYRMDPNSRAFTKLAPADASSMSSVSLSRDVSMAAFLSANATSMSEVFSARLDSVSGASRTIEAKKLTDMNAQTTNWTTSTLEVVSWKSQDGATIEGVLHKPTDFDASRKYPLLVVIHGGPTGVSRAVPFTAPFIQSTCGYLAASSSSSRIIAAAPDTARSSVR